MSTRCSHPGAAGPCMPRVSDGTGGVPYFCPRRYRFIDYNPRGHQWGPKRSGGWAVCDWCNAVEGSEEAGERCPQAQAWADDPEWHRVSKFGGHAVGYQPPYPEPVLDQEDAAHEEAMTTTENEDTDHLIYEAVAAERQRCAEKCQAIMRRHMEAESRKRTVEERSAEIAQALGAAECRGAFSPYVVRDMSDEIARYPTFAEALVRYLDLREVIRGRANIVNEDECDGATDGNQDGLTEDERGQL